MPKKVATLTFEDRLRRLQEVVTTLESGELALEESVNLYREGLGLSRTCREQLEKARNDVRILTAEGTLEPFTTTAEEATTDTSKML
ncbi:MAG: exodeoxyribonuclease VII small subunit [Bilophila sp.]